MHENGVPLRYGLDPVVAAAGVSAKAVVVLLAARR